MTGGAGLPGLAPAAPRGRGRPKGSKGKRAGDLKGIIDHRYGGSAALQSAQLAMVTLAELKAAGGSMAKAQVQKAADLVAYVREAQADQDALLHRVVREELEQLGAEIGEATAKELRQLVNGFIERVREAGSRFGLKEAMDLLARERAALLPYTDQRQPLAIEAKASGLQPSVLIMGATGPTFAAAPALENVGVFEGVFSEVSSAKSHDHGQAVDLPGLLPPPDAD